MRYARRGDRALHAFIRWKERPHDRSRLRRPAGL